MLDRTRVIATIAACMSATAVAAQALAPTTTAFDGTYAGVSRTFQGTMGAEQAARPESATHSQRCVPNGQPGPLTIASGVARYPTFRAGTWEGSVNAQGVLVIHGPYGNRIDAQIDGRGTVTGRFTGFRPDCSYQMVWQKEGR